MLPLAPGILYVHFRAVTESALGLPVILDRTAMLPRKSTEIFALRLPWVVRGYVYLLVCRSSAENGCSVEFGY